jgi:hypothetical protein
MCNGPRCLTSCLNSGGADFEEFRAALKQSKAVPSPVRTALTVSCLSRQSWSTKLFESTGAHDVKVMAVGASAGGDNRLRTASSANVKMLGEIVIRHLGQIFLQVVDNLLCDRLAQRLLKLGQNPGRGD